MQKLYAKITTKITKGEYIDMWGFPKIVGKPQYGWFIMENPIKWMIWGYHHLRKHPCRYILAVAPGHRMQFPWHLNKAWDSLGFRSLFLCFMSSNSRHDCILGRGRT